MPISYLITKPRATHSHSFPFTGHAMPAAPLPRLANIVSDRESAANVTALPAAADCAAPPLLLLLPSLWLPNQKQKLHKPQLCDRRVEAATLPPHHFPCSSPPPYDQLTYAQQHVCAPVWEVGGVAWSCWQAGRRCVCATHVETTNG